MVVLALGQLARASIVAYRDALEPGQRANVRLRAASDVLSHFIKLRELTDFDERLAALDTGLYTKIQISRRSRFDIERTIGGS
jgi:hypothetical protein